MDDPELAALQATLVAALARAGSPAEAMALLAAAAPESFQHWIAASDPRAIETAMELVRRWAEPLELALPADR